MKWVDHFINNNAWVMKTNVERNDGNTGRGRPKIPWTKWWKTPNNDICRAQQTLSDRVRWRETLIIYLTIILKLKKKKIILLLQ